MKGLVLVTSLLVSTGAWAAEPAHERLGDTATVFHEIMSTPDKGIPQDLLAKSRCIIIIPSMKKAAFVVGAQYGRGFAECRKSDGVGWTAPAAMRMEGGSVGFQIGGTETDLVLLVMNEGGMHKLLGDKFTLGADASVAAGPVGRTASADTDVKMSAEILSWSRAHGVFAGISLNGATLRPDNDSNSALYGKKLTPREILMSDVPPPPEAHALTAELDRYSSRAGSADREKH
jgi:SH3 domain-containing YSC84-like protein 1